MNPEFEVFLAHSLDEIKDSKVKEAMLYSLCAKGKRIRPALLFMVLEAYGCNQKIGYECASGIEMIHTYSLIHDDLPCMDDDDLRRGKPTCHKQFNEAIAVLAGDALLTQAFLAAAKSSDDFQINTQITALFAKKSGANGMIYGQNCDLELEGEKNVSLAMCQNTDLYKTGCLCTLPLLCGALLAHHPEDLSVWEEIGEALGLAFQVQDDILDVESNEAIMGKSLSDSHNQKNTYVSLLGVEKAQQFVDQLFDKIDEKIMNLDINHTIVNELMNTIKNRKH